MEGLWNLAEVPNFLAQLIYRNATAPRFDQGTGKKRAIPTGKPGSKGIPSGQKSGARAGISGGSNYLPGFSRRDAYGMVPFTVPTLKLRHKRCAYA